MGRNRLRVALEPTSSCFSGPSLGLEIRVNRKAKKREQLTELKEMLVRWSREKDPKLESLTQQNRRQKRRFRFSQHSVSTRLF